MGKQERITVYEHQALKISSDERFTSAHLDALQRYHGQGSNYFSLIHNGVLFKQFVGVLQVGSLTIEVLPKVDKGENDEALWQSFLIDMLKASGISDIGVTGDAHLKTRRNSILEYYIEYFLKEVQYLVRRGLVKKYRKTEGNSYALKGSLLFAKNIQQNLIHAERFYVRYSTYDRNNVFNKILYKTLRFISDINVYPKLTSQIDSLILDFPELPDIAIKDSLFEKLVYDRKTESYRKAINIARLLLLMYHPDIKAGKNEVLALMFDMNILWEKYVYKQLRRRLFGNYLVVSQSKTNFWKPLDGNMVKLKPDLVVYNKDNHVVVVLDTKWKNINGNKPTMDDLRQMMAYNYYWDSQQSALVFPSSKDQNNFKLSEGRFQKDNTYCNLIFLPIEKLNNSMSLNMDELVTFIQHCDQALS